MWRFYTAPDGYQAGPSAELVAEHVALVLFGFHQQSIRGRLMHRPGVSLGRALRSLRATDRFRDRADALDRRVAAAATATTLAELGWHLRTLVMLLKDAEIGFDYSKLSDDLAVWQRPGGPDRIRRQWGRDYFAWGEPEPANAEHAVTS